MAANKTKATATKTTAARKPKAKPAEAAPNPPAIAPDTDNSTPEPLKPGDRVGVVSRANGKFYQVYQIESIDALQANLLHYPSRKPYLMSPLPLSDLQRWDGKYLPGSWVRLSGDRTIAGSSLFYVDAVAALNAEPRYLLSLAPWAAAFAPATYIPAWQSEAEIGFDVSAPAWAGLAEDDRVATQDENLWASGTIEAAPVGTDLGDLEFWVHWDDGEAGAIDMRSLQPFPLHWRVGDRITEDINTENAYKDGWAEESSRTHGTIVGFDRLCGKFSLVIEDASGNQHKCQSIDCQPYAGNTALPPVEPTPQPPTAEQVMAEMEAAMAAAKEASPPEPIEIAVQLAPTLNPQPGDRIRFRLHACGQDREATGVCTHSDIPGTVRADYTLALPPKEELDPVYHENYPAGGKLSGNCQFPVEQVLEILPSEALVTTLTTLADRFNQLEAHAEEARATQIAAGRSHWESRREQGEILLEAKSQVAHGQWENWIAENCKVGSAPLSVRMAQNYMGVARYWEEFSKNETHFVFDWNKGLAEISRIRKALKPKQPSLIELAEHQGDDRLAPSPSIDELKALYAPIGQVTPWRDGFIVERPDLGNPFPLSFSAPAIAWAYWQQRGEKLLALADRKPKPAAPTPPATPAAVEEKYEHVEDITIPHLAELTLLYDPIGSVSESPDGKGFSVLRSDGESLEFKSRSDAWNYWQQHKDFLRPAVVEAETTVGAVLNGYSAAAGIATFESVEVQHPTPTEVLEQHCGHLPEFQLIEQRFAQSIELITEYLGEDVVAIQRDRVAKAAEALGGLPVALLALHECDRDDLAELKAAIAQLEAQP